ncbi:hypothetical protein I4U23_031358 [Adineta vaga]|nr:hypothetical protein I4U23_031358 [Adineta vaga]
MFPSSRLIKDLYTQITELKLCQGDDKIVKFILEKSPFNDDDDEVTDANSKDFVIIGRIFRNSDIYREGSFQIEIKLNKTLPLDPLEVRFLTPIYHPNVNNDGFISFELLKRSVHWLHKHSLVAFVRANCRLY